MSSKSTKWSLEVINSFIQEENMLRLLKEEQNSVGQVNWENIAINLNKVFLSNKSSKQCR